MENEEPGEFQEKVGLKRKLTGPPRLLLGKTKSPTQDEKKSDAQALRKQRREKNNGSPKHMAEEQNGNEDGGCESQQVMCQSPTPALAVEEETCTDFQEESFETASKSENCKDRREKRRMKQSRAKAAIRRVFSPAFMCARRRKPLDIKSVEDAEDNETHTAHINLQDTETKTTCELLTLSGVGERHESVLSKKHGTSKGKRKFHVRIWPIFKRLSAMSNSNQKQDQGFAGQDNDTFIEITSERSIERSSSAANQSDYCTPEPSGDKAVAEQLQGSSEIHEDMARLHKECCPRKDEDHELEGTKKALFSAEVNEDLNHEEIGEVHCPEQDLCTSQTPDLKDEIRTTEMAISEPETCSHEANRMNSVPGTSADIDALNLIPNDMAKTVPIQNEVKCKPVITIEDAHSSDDEIQEPVENSPLQRNTLSPHVSVNGTCHRLNVNRTARDVIHPSDHSDNNSQLSEILLVQTAFSLVHAAINSAIEQLSAEIQSNQIEHDHA